MNTPNDNNKPLFTLEMICQQKAVKREEIRASRKRINDITKQMFHPAQEAVGSANALINNFHSGVAIFNGIMTGFKIIKRLRSFFQRKR